jgi:integrase
MRAQPDSLLLQGLRRQGGLWTRSATVSSPSVPRTHIHRSERVRRCSRRHHHQRTEERSEGDAMILRSLTTDWITRLQNRKRRPCKPASIFCFSSYIQKHINPFLGDQEVEAIGNKQLKEFAEALVAKNLAPKTILEIVNTTKQCIASAQDDNGSQPYPRAWNNNWVLEGVPDVRNQKQPLCTAEMLKNAMKVRHASTDKYRIIIALLAASGLRVGELVSLRVGDDGEHSGWDQENSLLAIRTSLWRGKEQQPKTLNSIRVVDLSAPVNAMLAAYVVPQGKKNGNYLFATRKGTPYAPAFLREHALTPLNIPGFHSLRRWRVSWLRSTGTPESLLKLWIGHANGNDWSGQPTGSDITSIYDKSAEDRVWRLNWATRLGVGFDLPTSSQPAPRPKPSSASAPTPRKKSFAAHPRSLRSAQQAEERRRAALQSISQQ